MDVSQHIKRALQHTVRAAHTTVLKRGLPTKIGLLFHDLPRTTYPALRELVAYFRKEGYRFTSPDSYLARADEKCVFLSFDDSYRSWYEAIPLFAELDVSATFYVNTGCLRDRASEAEIRSYYGQLNFTGEDIPLSTEELRTLAQSGHTIGAHTHSHPQLSRLPFEEAKNEISINRAALEDILGCDVRHFAYPYGMRRHFSEELRAWCKSVGFATIAQAIPAMLHAPPHPYNIQRSTWREDWPLADNIENLRIDGRYFERFTGRSAVG